VLFSLIKISDGSYAIINKSTNKAVDIDGKISTYTGAARQRWFFEKVDFGVAREFDPKKYGYATDDPYINCYLYALGITTKPAVAYDDNISLAKGDDIAIMRESVLNDVKNTRKRGIRTITGPTAPLNSGEYRFCMRIGILGADGKVINNDAKDYHFWVQTNDGRWANKHGWFNAAEYALNDGYGNPSTQTGTSGWHYIIDEFYNSDTVYFAVKAS